MVFISICTDGNIYTFEKNRAFFFISPVKQKLFHLTNIMGGRIDLPKLLHGLGERDGADSGCGADRRRQQRACCRHHQGGRQQPLAVGCAAQSCNAAPTHGSWQSGPH
jgi:hypothetical protein